MEGNISNKGAGKLSAESIKQQTLARSIIFGGLTEDELTELGALTSFRRYRSGEFIFWEGDPPHRFYVVASGKVKIVKHSSLGKEIVLAFFGAGDMFGEVAVFESKPYPGSALAVSDTEILSIQRKDLLSFLADRPATALRIINVLGGRLREAQSRLRDLAGERVEQRVARTLLMLTARLGLTLPFTRQEIADMSGTTIETTIRVMSRLREAGIIRSDRGRTIILDEVKLRLLSEGPPKV